MCFEKKNQISAFCFGRNSFSNMFWDHFIGCVMLFKKIARQVGHQFCLYFCTQLMRLSLKEFVKIHKKMQNCPTCFEPLTSGSTNHTVTTPCGHLFHINCVQGWIARGNQTCPQCRSDISNDKLLRIYLQASESHVEILHETDEIQQKTENSRCSMTANSVAYSVSQNSPSARSTRSKRHARSTRSEGQVLYGNSQKQSINWCGILIFMVIWVLVLLAVQNSGKDQVSFKN